MSLQTDPAGSDRRSPADVLAAVRAATETVYRDTARQRRDAVPEALLGADLGLDSLDLAQVVVLLERDLGVDPFRDPPPASDTAPIRTVGDLVARYVAATGGVVVPPPASRGV